MRATILASLMSCLANTGFAFAETSVSEDREPLVSDDATTIENDEAALVAPDPHDPWDGRRYWYCNAAPHRWAGSWDRRDYEAFGHDYWRVHKRAERRCERFHRRCIVWCERRHQWEWDGDLPGPVHD